MIKHLLQKVFLNFTRNVLSPHVSESRFQNPRNFRFWNPESWAFEPGILLMIGIRNPTENKWNPALLGIWNSLSWNSESSTRNPESTMRNAESNTVMDSLTRGESYWGVKIYKQKQVSASSQILDQIIWNDKFPKIGAKPLCWRALVNKGVVRGKGLFDTGGKLHKWNTLYAAISHKLNILF